MHYADKLEGIALDALAWLARSRRQRRPEGEAATVQILTRWCPPRPRRALHSPNSEPRSPRRTTRGEQGVAGRLTERRRGEMLSAKAEANVESRRKEGDSSPARPGPARLRDARLARFAKQAAKRKYLEDSLQRAGDASSARRSIHAAQARHGDLDRHLSARCNLGGAVSRLTRAGSAVRSAGRAFGERGSRREGRVSNARGERDSSPRASSRKGLAQGEPRSASITFEKLSFARKSAIAIGERRIAWETGARTGRRSRPASSMKAARTTFSSSSEPLSSPQDARDRPLSREWST